MPSPFPGMDPYLEDPDIFPSLHGNLVFAIQESLQPRLPEPYFAKTNERVWVEMTTRYIEPEYHVCIHRFDNLEDYFVYPIQLAAPPPEIAVPLLPGDGDVRLDLQAAMNRAYDAGPYRREIDYAQDKMTPPLRPPLAKWAKSVVSSRAVARAQKS